MIAKALIAIGFLFLLVTVGPWVIETVSALIEAGQQVKDAVNP